MPHCPKKYILLCDFTSAVTIFQILNFCYVFRKSSFSLKLLLGPLEFAHQTQGEWRGKTRNVRLSRNPSVGRSQQTIIGLVLLKNICWFKHETTSDTKILCINSVVKLLVIWVKYGKPIWQLVIEAADQIENEEFASSDIVKKVHETSSDVPEISIKSYVIAMTPNHHFSGHWPSLRKNHPYFYYLGNGKFKLLKSAENG